MKKCPKCNTPMNFNMTYNAGYPVIEYKCYWCGYSSKDETYTITDNKAQVDKDWKPNPSNRTYRI